MISWISIALAGSLVGLDSTAFPQAMFSRPLVAGALGGLAFGGPVEGMLAGGTLELFALVTLPVGASRYPEAGTGAVAAGAALAASSGQAPAPVLLLLALVFGLGWERLAGLSVVLLRRENERLVARDTREPPLPREIERRHLGAMTLDMLRGLLMALAGALAGSLLLRLLAPAWSAGPTAAAGVVTICATGMAAAALPLFGGLRARSLVFAAGLACGILLVLVA